MLVNRQTTNSKSTTMLLLTLEDGNTLLLHAKVSMPLPTDAVKHKMNIIYIGRERTPQLEIVWLIKNADHISMPQCQKECVSSISSFMCT